MLIFVFGATEENGIIEDAMMWVKHVQNFSFFLNMVDSASIFN
jgi:hypothetical protein